jgi:UDP-glucose 4-epimerase
MNILAACSGRTRRSQVHLQVVDALLRVRAGRPGVLHGVDAPAASPRTPIERDIVEAEAAISDFSEKQPETCVTILRCPNVLGPDVDTPLRRLASLPVVPGILGFDPRLQAGARGRRGGRASHATQHELPASTTSPPTACSRSARSPGLLGKPFMPFLPPWGTGLALARCAASA